MRDTPLPAAAMHNVTMREVVAATTGGKGVNELDLAMRARWHGHQCGFRGLLRLPVR